MVKVSWSIKYRISDLVVWAFRVTDQQKTIRDTCEAAMRILIGDRTLWKCGKLHVIDPELKFYRSLSYYIWVLHR